MITANATHNVLSITGTTGPTTVTVTLADGDWFIRGYTGEAIAAGRTGAQMCEEITAQVVAAGGQFASFSCTVSDAGIVTITNPTNVRIDASELTATLGYATAQLGVYGTSIVAANQHKFGWYPNVGPADFDGDPDLPSVRKSDAVVRRAPSGVVTVTQYGEFRDRTYQWRFVEDEYALPTGSVLNRSFEEFWQQVIAPGHRFRYYPDATVQTAPGGGEPWTYVGGQKIARAGSSALDRDVPAWSVLYKFPLDCHAYVSV